MNTLILRLKALQDFMQECQKIKQSLIDELIDNAMDPVIRMRRLRMLRHLVTYEATMLYKIANFDGDDFGEWQHIHMAITDLYYVANRSA